MTEHEKRVEYLLFNIFNYFTELHQLPYILPKRFASIKTKKIRKKFFLTSNQVQMRVKRG